MLCKDCHSKTGCPVIHPDVISNKCDGCGKEALCVDCQMLTRGDLREILGDLDKNLSKIINREVTQEEMAAGMARYPGFPIPVAVTRYIYDQFNEGFTLFNLHKGTGWGGIHLERVGAMVQQIADAMYHQCKKSINIKIECENYPESWDHIWLEITDVQGGEEADEKNQTKET